MTTKYLIFFIKAASLRVFLSSAATIIGFFCFSQSNTKPLNVGDTIPNLIVRNIVNGKASSLQTSDFKGKILLIDFWATWCSPCLAGLPKLDSIKKEFADVLEVLPVTYEKSTYVKAILPKLKKTLNVNMYSATEDTILSNYFPHTYIPHYVWVDRNGVVIGITEGDEINRKTVLALKNGEALQFRLKQDYRTRAVVSTIFKPSVERIGVTDKNAELTLLSDSSIKFQSNLTSFVEGLHPGVNYRSPNGENGYILVRNRTIQGLYRVALLKNGLESLNNTLFDVEISDSSLYKRITGEGLDGTRTKAGLEALEFLTKYGYCYFLRVPESMEDRRFEIMLAELNAYFGSALGIEGALEKRNRKYLALVQSDKGKLIKRNSGVQVVKKDRFSLVLQNAPISELVDALATELVYEGPVFNESNINDNISLTINCKLSDLEQLNLELARYGLKLEEKSKPMDVAVIREMHK